MRKTKELLVLFIICLFFSLIFQMSAKRVYAESKNEVTLNFKGGTIHDGYVEYSEIAKVQLFKGDEVVTDISNNMVIDLNEADYEFVIQEIPAEDTGSVVGPAPVKLNINDWYYATTTLNSKVIFKLESSKFSGTLDVKLVRTRTVVNTTVKNVYNDISSKGVIDLTGGQEYVIDFSKDDELTNGLKSFADLDKTLYYKRDNEGLLATDNESEAVIKIVGNKSENKAILTAVNVGTKKSEVFKGLHTKYTGSALKYDSTVGEIILETRFDYYTKCKYEFTFQYTKEEVTPREYNFIEGANQIYTIDESKDATFRIDADYKLFANKVYVDNKLLDVSNYNSKSGSTIIILKDEYLKTLSIGKHTLKVAFSDGKNAVTNFEIKSKQANINGDNNNENNEEQENSIINNNAESTNIQKENNSTNPKTGDNVIVYFALFTITILLIVTLVIINNKKRKKLRKH